VPIAPRRGKSCFPALLADPRDSKPGQSVVNRTVTLRDTWAKEAAKA
jgi:hypothetical protein